MSDSIEELATKLEEIATGELPAMPATLRAAALKLRECSEAIRGVLGDDDAATSLADQRARWPERMAALKRAMGE